MEARVRKGSASVYATVGVHAGVAIEVQLDPDDGDGAQIRIGDDGPDVVVDVADVESMELLAEVTADGARRMRDRAAAHRAEAVR